MVVMHILAGLAVLANQHAGNHRPLNSSSGKHTSGKMVVRWFSQSFLVGSSPGSAGRRPSMKSRNDCPAALMYFPSLHAYR